MQITLVDANTMRLAFRYDEHTKEFVKALFGSEYEGKEAKTWAVPLYHLRTVVTAHPFARIAPDVIEARYALWRRFIANYAALGVEFAYTHDGRVTCWPAEHISPLLMEIIEQRSAQLAPWLGNVEPRRTGRTECPVAAQVESGARGDDLLVRSIQNAYRRSEGVAGRRERARMSDK